MFHGLERFSEFRMEILRRRAIKRHENKDNRPGWK
jgi:hypothetical protein